MAKRNLITKQDLETSQQKLLESINELLNEHSGVVQRKWLKSSEVIDMFRISPATLVKLREQGKLPHFKLSGILYYDYADILRLIEANKINGSSNIPETGADKN